MASVAKGEWDLPMIASVATCHLTGQYCKGMASLFAISFTERLVVGCGFCTFGDPLNLQLVRIVQSRTHNSTV